VRIFYSTVLLERGAGYPLDLISIGIVREGTNAYYAVNADFDVDAALDHLDAEVWDTLPVVGGLGDGVTITDIDRRHPDVKPRELIAQEVAAFVLAEPEPELWAYHGAYNHVALTQLFGRETDLPDGFPGFTYSLMQEILITGVEIADLPARPVSFRSPVDGARWNRHVARYLDGLPVIGGVGRG
jgi:hypothetical protein